MLPETFPWSTINRSVGTEAVLQAIFPLTLVCASVCEVMQAVAFLFEVDEFTLIPRGVGPRLYSFTLLYVCYPLSLILASVSIGQGTLSVELAIREVADVLLATIRPCSRSFSVRYAIFERASVLTSICPSEYSLSLSYSRNVGSLVLRTVDPSFQTLPMRCTIFHAAFVPASIWSSKRTLSLHFPSLEASDVSLAIRPGVLSVTMHLSIL